MYLNQIDNFSYKKHGKHSELSFHYPQTLRFDKFFKRDSLIILEVSLCCEISSIGGAGVELELFFAVFGSLLMQNIF